MSFLLDPIESTPFSRGLEAYRNGKFNFAEAELRSALEADPDDVEAKHVLALVLRALGQRQEASFLLAAVVAANPDDAESWSNYGALLRELGLIEQSLHALETAVKLEPRNPIALNNLGTALIDAGDTAQGRARFEEALALKPAYADAQINLARASFESGKIEEAKKLVSSAIALDPTSAEAQNRLSFIQAASGEVESALKSTAKAHDLDPRNDQITSNMFLRALSCDTVTAQEIVEQAKAWGRRFGSTPRMCSERRGSIKRVGFVSGDLRKHPVGFFVSPVIQHLAEHAEVFCYATLPQEDAVTQQIKASCTGWSVVYRTPAQEMASLIARDKIDVLVDLSGHTGDNRLDVFARRPAPVQVTWLGYSGTTGLPQMDAILADATLIPAGADHLYSEHVARLPHSFLCANPVMFTEVQRVRPTNTVFGVFNNPSKFSTTAFRLWAEVLRSCPGSQILFKYHHSHDRYVQRQTIARLCEHGVVPEQVTFAPFASREEHCRTLASVTAALDTFPYSGATTTLDCMACGVPVVTLVGDRYASRMSASMLNTIGATNLVCETEESYVEKAVAIAQGWSAGQLREMLIESPLCDTRLFAASFLELLQQLP